MRYVAVSTEDFDKVIKFGPFELEDPSEYVPAEGTRLMLEEEALAAGYRYPEGGGAGVAPGECDPGASSGRGQKRGHDKHGDKHDGKHGH